MSYGPSPLDEQQAAPPPDLAALLGGGGQAPEDSMPSDPADILREMLNLANQYREVETDEEDLHNIEKATTILQSILAAQQKESDGMMSGKVSPRGLRRAYGG